METTVEKGKLSFYDEEQKLFLLGSYNAVNDIVDLRISIDLLKNLEGQAFLITSIKRPDRNAVPLDRRTALNAENEDDPAACVIKFKRIPGDILLRGER